MTRENTGYIGDNDFLYEHIILESYEENLLEDLKEESKNKNVLISIKKNGTIDFIHVSLCSNKDSIEKIGIVISNIVGDLGKGIYATYKSGLESIIGMENLKDYVAEQYENEDSILLVTGTYSGNYLECVYDLNHEGYLVFENNILPENIHNIEIVDFGDFFFDY